MPKQIIFLMTDSQRYDMVNCNVSTGLSTPCLDRLAASGTRFTRAYTTQPVCQPARAGIFTGMYPHSSGSWTNSMGVAENIHNAGERMQRMGVHTAYIGKWHLDGGDYFGLGHASRGWDPEYWYDMRNYLEELTPEERLLSRNAENMRTHDFPAEFTYAWRCSSRAIEFLEKHREEDFLLVVSYDEPHDPYICPPEYARMYEEFDFPLLPSHADTLEGKPDYQRVWAAASSQLDPENPRVRAPWFFGCNSYVDSQIGRVLDAAAQYAPEALLLYTSDHGDFLHEHRLAAKGPAAYDAIAHIPLFIAGPGLPQGQVDGNPVSHIDLLPTMLAWMGAEQPPILPGHSLLPQITGECPRVNDCVFLEFGRYEVDHDGFGGLQLMRSVFDGRYKLSVNLLSTDELYDLQEDPYEVRNLIDDPAYAAVRDKLHDRLLDNMDKTRDPFRGYYWERRPWRTDAPAASWRYRGFTRQSLDDFEPRQLDYGTGLPMEEATRVKPGL
ncbi:MAG TPA: sulfatase-like hydrolase/transferase [Candidatus Caccousia avistercoris]|nr:sulfatase-like hydrolase/transferase [Candidatus Caccousia avistercoris]